MGNATSRDLHQGDLSLMLNRVEFLGLIKVFSTLSRDSIVSVSHFLFADYNILLCRVVTRDLCILRLYLGFASV